MDRDLPTPVDAAQHPFVLNRGEARVLLESSETCATTVVLVAQMVFGPDVWDANPSEVAAALEAEFDCDMSESSYNKLQALYTALTTPLFFQSVPAFAAICSTLSDGDPIDSLESLMDGDVDGPALLWGVQEVGMFMGDDCPTIDGQVFNFVKEVFAQESGSPDETGQPGYQMAYVREKMADLRSELIRIGAPPALLLEILN